MRSASCLGMVPQHHAGAGRLGAHRDLSYEASSFSSQGCLQHSSQGELKTIERSSNEQRARCRARRQGLASPQHPTRVARPSIGRPE
jgi:hypothetical protein